MQWNVLVRQEGKIPSEVIMIKGQIKIRGHTGCALNVDNLQFIKIKVVALENVCPTYSATLLLH